MKKTLILLLTVTALQAESLNEAFAEAKVDGEIKIVHYSRDATNSPIFPKANGTAMGGNFGLSTKEINNITFNTRFFTTYAIRPISGTDSELSSTNLVNGTENYTLLGEFNLEYKDDKNMLRIGRQELHTPLVASDDARVVKDLFEAINYETKIIQDTIFRALYVYRNSGMDNGYDKSKFISMSKTLGTSYHRGMSIVSLENSSIKNLKLQLWYYNSFKLIDMFYYDAAYTWKFSEKQLFKLEGHFWSIKSKSDYNKDTGKKIDYNYGGLRANYIYDSLLLQLAQEQINYADKTVGIHTKWGMYTEYTYGYLMGSGIYGAVNGFGDQYITKVNATKATLRYDFGDDIDIYLGYNIYNANNDAFMSDMNLLNLYIGFPAPYIKNAKVSILYENWDSNGNKIMVDNNLLRLKFKYTF